jgi:large subunit ribosomal protein L4
MKELTVYNQSGKETGKVKLPESVFGLSWNADLVHQVVTSMMANKRTPVAHTKDRSEVSGVNKKPWRQKGTGRARHGSRRSPIWRTGGVAHGPRNEKVYSRKINKKMRAKALFVVLSQKLKDGEIIFVDDLKFDKPKTAEASGVLKAISKVKGYEKLANKRKNALLLATDGKDLNTEKSFSNFGNIAVGESRNLNPADILNYKFLMIENPEKTVKFLESRLSAKAKEVKKVEGKPVAKQEIVKTKK